MTSRSDFSCSEGDSKSRGATLVSPPIGHARFLTRDDFVQVIALREKVFTSLRDREHIYPEDDDRAFVEKTLSALAGAIGVFVGERLIAVGDLSLPDETEWGTFWFGDRRWPIAARTAVLLSSLVLPEYEGKGLQRFLIAARLARCLQAGRDEVRTLTSFSNHRSWGNLLRAGFVVAGSISFTTRKHGLLHRYVLTSLSPSLAVSEERTIDYRDSRLLVAALEDGFTGVEKLIDDRGISLKLVR